MNRTPIAIRHRIANACLWYGTDYNFTRAGVNDYGEPTENFELVQTICGIYHDSRKSFLELVNAESAVVKNKTNRGILCEPCEILIKQGDKVHIDSTDFYVTAVEPVKYGDVVIAMEISIEERINV